MFLQNKHIKSSGHYRLSPFCAAVCAEIITSFSHPFPFYLSVNVSHFSLPVNPFAAVCNSCFSLPDKAGLYLGFSFRIGNTGCLSCLDAFDHPGHILSDSPHDLQTFQILSDLFRFISVNHMPVI